MHPQEQAYIEGFLKRAAEYNYSEAEAIALFKQAGVSWRTSDGSIRRKLYELLNNTEAKRLTDKAWLNHPHGVDASRLAILSNSFKKPDNSQAARVKEAIKDLLSGHQENLDHYITPNLLDSVRKPYGLLDKLTLKSKPVKLTPDLVKKKILETGGLYTKPNLP